MKKIITASLFGLAIASPLDLEATEWTAVEPARYNLNVSPVLRAIPDINDPKFMSQVTDLERSLQDKPTRPGNLDERAELAGQYYDALQNSGVLLNWRLGSEFNRARILKLSGDLDSDEQMPNLIEKRFREMRAAHKLAGKTGRVILRSPVKPELQAKRYATVKLEYVIDTPLVQGARIRIGQNWYGDLGRIQFSRPLAPNYASVSPSNTDAELETGARIWFGNAFTGLSGGNRPFIALKKGQLAKGDRITLTLGDTSHGSPGWLIQSFTSDAMDLKIEVDFQGNGVFVPVAQPRFRVYGNDASHLRVVGPSVIRPGASFTIRTSVEDQYFNRAASNLPKTLELWYQGDRISRTRSLKGDPATFHFQDITLPSDEDTPLYLEVRDRSGEIVGISNPIVTRGDGKKLYWGELHGHEGYTDGNGTPEWYMNYARNVAFLDFASLTGHDVMLSEVHFRHNFLASDAYNQPDGGFVTFRAYEWTNNWRYGGHHNVFLLDDSQRAITVMDAPQLSEMIAAHKKINDRDKVLLIPHAHQPGDWNIKGAELVEIFAQHGSFEWFGREYLIRGHKVGLLAASDDHIGHPGNTPSRGRTRGGLAAVFAPNLTNESVFANLKERHTYGTSLARIYLETSIDGAEMGDMVEATGPINVKGFTAGTDEITDITLIVNGEEVQEQRFDEPDGQNSTLRFRLTRDSSPTSSDAPRTPAPDRRYWGRIFIHETGDEIGQSEGSQSQTTVEAIVPLGYEPYADVIKQTGSREATFTNNVRGDYDGMLLKLAKMDENDLVTIMVMTSPIDDTDHWNMIEKPRLPGEYYNVDVPRQEIVLQETVRLGDLLDGHWEASFDDYSSADIALIKTGNPKYQSFNFTVTEADGLKFGEDNHIYVRVKQLDDETAWSSPTFIEWHRN
ncbi:MAG: hypothetical protein WD002_04055 [Pseudomonadales bacterium]